MSTDSGSHQGKSVSPSDASLIVQNDQQSTVHVHTSADESIAPVIDKSCYCSPIPPTSACDNEAGLAAPHTASDDCTNSPSQS